MAEKFVISSSQFSSNIDENQFEQSSTTEKKVFLDEADLLDFYDLEKCIECVKDCKIETPKVRTPNEMYRQIKLRVNSHGSAMTGAA